MRAVRADGELELKQEFVRSGAERVVGAPVLPANLAELARPVREDQRPARIEQRRVGRAVAAVVPRAHEPAPPELIIAGDVHAHAALKAVLLIAAAPYPFRPAHEGVIDRSLQRPPAERRVDAVQLSHPRPEVRRRAVEQQSIMTARIRRAEIDVAVLGDVLIRPQMSDVTHLAAPRRLEPRASLSAGLAA